MCKNEIITYLRNSKIEKEKILEICYFFSKDYTAIETSKKVNLSRQTINNYYKIMRATLNININKIKNNYLCNEVFYIRYLYINSKLSYFIECNENNFTLDINNTCLKKINIFIKENLNENKINPKKTNCAKILFNKNKEEFFITKIYKINDGFDSFIFNRLKKFRGLNKNNYVSHITESLIRYNNAQSQIYNILIKNLNLKNETSTF